MTDFILNHSKYRASLIARLKYGMDMVEWKTEWNSASASQWSWTT